MINDIAYWSKSAYENMQQHGLIGITNRQDLVNFAIRRFVSDMARRKQLRFIKRLVRLSR